MIKHLFPRHLAVLISLLAILTATAEEGFWHNGIRYVVTGSNTVAVASSLDSSYSGDIIIPETVNDDSQSTYTVTAINDSAFAECNDLTRVVVPNTVTAIGVRAFHRCLFLTGVELPESLNSIGKAAFASCQSLQDISIPGSLSVIQDSTFNSCSGLTAISIPNSVTTVI